MFRRIIFTGVSSLIFTKTFLCEAQLKPSKKPSLQEQPGVILWGSNEDLLLQPTNTDLKSCRSPARLPFFDGYVFKKLCFSKGHAAALTSDGKVFIWGRKYFDIAHEPQQNLTKIDLIELCSSFGYALSLNRKTLLRWKAEKDASTQTINVKLGNKDTITKISSTEKQLFILSDSGRVYTLFHDSAILEEIKGITGKVSDIATGENHMLARTEDGRVYGMGSNLNGELGEGITDIEKDSYFKDPIELRKIWNVLPSAESPKVKNSTIEKIYAAGNTSFFVKSSPELVEVFSCGLGINGQLGSGSPLHTAVEPVRMNRVSGLFSFDEKSGSMKSIGIEKIESSGTHAFIVLHTSENAKIGNDVLSFGSNGYGECLADKMQKNVLTPSIVKPFEDQPIERFQLFPAEISGSQRSGWYSYFFPVQDRNSTSIDIAVGPNISALYSCNS